MERKLLKFSADWCGPCKVMVPLVARLGDQHGIEIETIDVDSNEDRMNEHGVMGVPTLILMEDDVEVARVVGAMPYMMLEKKLAL